MLSILVSEQLEEPIMPLRILQLFKCTQEAPWFWIVEQASDGDLFREFWVFLLICKIRCNLVNVYASCMQC